MNLTKQRMSRGIFANLVLLQDSGENHCYINSYSGLLWSRRQNVPLWAPLESPLTDLASQAVPLALLPLSDPIMTLAGIPETWRGGSVAGSHASPCRMVRLCHLKKGDHGFAFAFNAVCAQPLGWSPLGPNVFHRIFSFY